MNSAVRFGHIAGAEVIVDVSVLGVAGLLGWLQALALDGTYDAGTIGSILGLAMAAAYVGSLLVHEATHALVAVNRGLTARRIRLLVFGGYSVIEGHDSSPANEFWVAMAGPVASLATGGLMWGLAWVMGWHEPTAETLRLLAIINVLIAAFNVLPGLPLDGGRALRALLWNLNGDRLRSTQLATIAGRALGLGIAGVGVYLLVTSAEFGGAVWMLLGWFLFRSATVSGKREELIALSAGSVARDVMRPTPEAVPGALRVAEVALLFQVGPTLRTLPVEVEGRVTGTIGQAEIDGLAPGRRELGRASQVMTPIGPGDVIDASTPVDTLIARASGFDRLVVVEDGTVIGVIERGDLEAVLG